MLAPLWDQNAVYADGSGSAQCHTALWRLPKALLIPLTPNMPNANLVRPLAVRGAVESAKRTIADDTVGYEWNNAI
jgi:hypothetical protein